MLANFALSALVGGSLLLAAFATSTRMTDLHGLAVLCCLNARPDFLQLGNLSISALKCLLFELRKLRRIWLLRTRIGAGRNTLRRELRKGGPFNQHE